MKSLDKAYESFLEIKASVPPEDDKPINEACTRFKLIDPILVDVLGWPRGCVEAELPAGEPVGEGESKGRARLDYLLRDHAGTKWFVLEAKSRKHAIVARDGKQGDQPFKLSGPAFSKECWSIIDKQMAPYLGRYMPQFGIVTNGDQWVGFLGAARPTTVDLGDTLGVLFRSLDHIASDFERFYDLFSVDGAQRRRLHRELDPDTARGTIRCMSPERVVKPGEEKLLSYQQREDFYNDLKRAMNAAFKPIHDDPEALARCFVESRQSQEADSRLMRMASELGEALSDAALQYPPTVTDGIREAREAHEESLPQAEELEGQGYLARLIGETSAGKTVFLKRFYTTSLSKQREHIVLIWIDAEKIEPFSADDASREALDQIKKELFGEDGPERKHLKEVYAKEWQAHLRLLGADDDSKPETWHEFALARQRDEEEHPRSALKRYAAFAVRNRRKLPCIVVDNIDDLGRPAEAVAWAIAVHRSMYALTTVSMEDTTLWRLRRSEEDQLSRHGPEQFWLSRPKVGDVLKKRCDYLQAMLTEQGGPSPLARTRLGRSSQFRWKVNADDLVRAVSAVLLDNHDIASWIGQICNYDIRSVLGLCKQIVLSPHVKIADLLSSQVTGRPPHPRNVLRAIIAPKSEQFLSQPTDVVMNVLSFWSEQDWAPLLPARILSLLDAREKAESNRGETFPGFLSAERLRVLFEEHCRTPSRVTQAALEKLSTVRLIDSYDPSHADLSRQDAKVKITPRGRLHLAFCIEQLTYVRMMAEVDPLVDQGTVTEMRDLFTAFLSAAPGAAMAQAERKLVERYVAYVLAQAREASPVSMADEMAPVREFEQKLGAFVSG